MATIHPQRAIMQQEGEITTPTHAANLGICYQLLHQVQQHLPPTLIPNKQDPLNSITVLYHKVHQGHTEGGG